MRLPASAKQAIGVVLAVVLVGALLLSPLSPAIAGRLAGLGGPTDSIRMLHYASNYNHQRDPSAYARASAGLPNGANNLLLFGSSEFGSDTKQNPKRFLVERVSNFDLFLSGRGHTQSLHHAMMLAAMGKDLKQKRVGLIISPQWFLPKGVNPRAMDEVFSVPAFNQVRASTALSKETKQRILDRLAELSVTAGPGIRSVPNRVAEWFGMAIRGRLETLKSSIHTSSLQAPYRVRSGAVPISQINWDKELAAAKQQGLAEARNAFKIKDSYFSKHIAHRLASLRGSMAAADYSQSPEYADLELFLAVAKDLGVEVLLISVPMNGYWYDYAGYPKERREVYYEKIRKIAQRPGVQLADFSSHDYDAHFLLDVMHLGWKGWLHVTRACADFANA